MTLEIDTQKDGENFKGKKCWLLVIGDSGNRISIQRHLPRYAYQLETAYIDSNKIYETIKYFEGRNNISQYFWPVLSSGEKNFTFFLFF